MPRSSVTVLTSSSTAEAVAAAGFQADAVVVRPDPATGAIRRRGRTGPARRALGDPVVWICALFVLNFAVQRISLPGLSIPLTAPLTVLWLGLAWKLGILAIEPRRLTLWLLGAGASALVVAPQLLWGSRPYVSVNSWAFWMVIWFPTVFMMAERTRATYERMLRAVTNVGVALGLVSMAFIAVQLAGLPYRDYLAEVLPPRLLVQNFNTSYPLFYGNPLYKSNGWLALEPSFMSFTLGLTILAGLLCGARLWKVAVMGLGLVATVAGSGFAIVIVGVLVMAVTRQRVLLAKYVFPGIVGAVLVAQTTIGAAILGRVDEAGQSRSSTSLRTLEPYLYLWPRWVEDWTRVIFGGGAGSSRFVAEGSGIRGLLAPTIGKIFYEYGLIVGVILFAVVLTCYVRTPEPAIAIAVAVSMCVVQPPAQPLLVPAFLLATLWAPTYRGNRLIGTGPEGPPRPPPSWLARRLARRRRHRISATGTTSTQEVSPR